MKRSIQLLPMEPPPLVNGSACATSPSNTKYVHRVEPEGKHSGKARRVFLRLEKVVYISYPSLKVKPHHLVALIFNNPPPFKKNSLTF